MTRFNTTEASADLAELLARATEGPWEYVPEDGPESGHSQRGNIGISAQSLYDAAVEANDEENEPDDAKWICGIWGAICDMDRANAALIARAPELAAEVLRLTALVAALTAANIALAADNARLSKRVDKAHRIMDRGLWLTDDAPAARAWLAGGVE